MLGEDEEHDGHHNATTRSLAVRTAWRRQCDIATLPIRFPPLPLTSLIAVVHLPVGLQGGPSGQIVGWVDLDLGAPPWHEGHCSYLLSKQDGATSPIPLNTTQLSEQIGHPV